MNSFIESYFVTKSTDDICVLFSGQATEPRRSAIMLLVFTWHSGYDRGGTVTVDLRQIQIYVVGHFTWFDG